MPRRGECFTWIDPEDESRVVTFDVWGLWRYAQTRPPSVERIHFPILPDEVAAVIATRSVDVSYARRLTLQQLKEPMLGVEMPDGTTLFVDGHHRFVRWAELEIPEGMVDRFDSMESIRRFWAELPPDLGAVLRAEIRGEAR